MTSARQIRQWGFEYDPFWTDVAALYEFDETPGGNLFANVKGGNAQRQGVYTTNCDTTSTQSKFGGRSMGIATRNGGVNDYSLYQAFTLTSLGTGNLFTIEGWFFTGGTVDSRACIGGIRNNSSSFVANIKFLTTNQIEFVTQLAGSNNLAVSVAGILNTWAHVAMTYDGTTKRCFINGTLVASAVIGAGAVQTIADYLSSNPVSGNAFAPFAYIDEVRITFKQCRYTANFTPPTKAFPRG